MKTEQECKEEVTQIAEATAIAFAEWLVMRIEHGGGIHFELGYYKVSGLYRQFIDRHASPLLKNKLIP